MNDSAQTKSPDDKCSQTHSSSNENQQQHHHVPEEKHLHPHDIVCLDDDDDVDGTAKSDPRKQPGILKHRRRRQQPRGGGGSGSCGCDHKRQRGIETVEEKVLCFKHSPHSLQISASSVAALCGLHPYQNLPQLLFDLVYQSYYGQLLLQQDAKLLGLTLVDAKTHEQETMLSLASSVSNETKELIQQVLEVSEGKRKLQSVEEVQSIQQQIKAQAIVAQQSGKLNQQQVDSLVESSRGCVSTGFGTCHEEEALDVYEKRVGARVRERNETYMEWDFQRRVLDSDSELGVTASPLGRARRRVREEFASRGEGSNSGDDGTSRDIADTDDGDNATNESINDGAKKVAEEIVDLSEDVKPFFRIVGAVDGIRDELYVDSPKTDNNVNSSNRQNNTGDISCSDNEEGQWSIRPIVVECKHRMKKAMVPPPIYDQIQTSIYCHMYNVEDADLIQVVRRERKSKKVRSVDAQENHSIKNDGDCKTNAKNTTHESGDHIDITVTRVSLNDPIYEHRHHWEATLLPRLASFVDAVYGVRQDDGKRYRLLLALIRSQHLGTSHDGGEEEAWRVLWDECRWIRDCDTAYEERRRWIENNKSRDPYCDR
ncbi:hypothetical protein ACHAWU_000070 [Discostella pseudostelligera]|uniref:Uncharacterized protein n=1 Tax=Discostella pseudostelligera TaxID=259834 RepID=A0ABD3MCB3_9STRA